MSQNGLMQDHLVDDLATKESEYWWHRIRRHNLIMELGDLPRGSRVLEVGSGTGANLRRLREQGFQITGMELDPLACQHSRDLNVVRGDALKPWPFPDGQFDAVILLDVLEHLNQPEVVIEHIRQVLKPGGRVVIMVPSGPELWSYWDEMLGHCRRYTPKTLSETFAKSWELRGMTHTFSWMYWPVRFIRKFNAGRKRSETHTDFVPLPAFINEMLVLIGCFETFLTSLVSLPFGTTLQGSWTKPA